MRLAHPKTRLEANTSRPTLRAVVGRMAQHARTAKLALVVTHEAVAKIKSLIASVRAGIAHIQASAPQLDRTQRRPAMLRYITEKVLASQLVHGSPHAVATG